MTPRPWYQHWQVWLCLALFALLWILELVAGIPLKILNLIASLFR